MSNTTDLTVQFTLGYLLSDDSQHNLRALLGTDHSRRFFFFGLIHKTSGDPSFHPDVLTSYMQSKQHRCFGCFPCIPSSRHQQQYSYILNTVISVIGCHALALFLSLYSVVSLFSCRCCTYLPLFLLNAVLGLWYSILTFFLLPLLRD